MLEDKTKIWYVKMPEFIELEMDLPYLKTPLLHMLEEDESDRNEYLDDPIDPVLCVPDQGHERYWEILKSQPECNFWWSTVYLELLAVVCAF